MGQSLARLVTHITFSTKYRQHFIDAHIENELHHYLGGVCNIMGCQSIKVGGYTDHVHILCLLSKKLALIDLLEEVKKCSSKWIKDKGKAYENFYWQNGYGAFSVNPSETGAVIRYIENQHIHHQKKTFQDEFRKFLDKYAVEYDERYVWD
jgi:putative transposase